LCITVCKAVTRRTTVLPTPLYSAARLQLKQPQNATVSPNFRGYLISRFYATQEIREN